jgi:hypothetical protein
MAERAIKLDHLLSVGVVGMNARFNIIDGILAFGWEVSKFIFWDLFQFCSVQEKKSVHVCTSKSQNKCKEPLTLFLQQGDHKYIQQGHQYP